MNCTRKLIYVPIIHTDADMGSLLEALKEEYESQYGKGKWEEHVQMVNRFWLGIREKILALNLPYQRLKIYQDGLPICGREREIVQEIAKRGSPNHQLILELMEKGAKLMGTEREDLLLAEYHQMQKLVEITNIQEKRKLSEEYRKRGLPLLRERDEFIAQRIAQTLEEGEIGLLFLGMLHNVAERLPKDIEVTYLFPLSAP